MCYYAQLTIVSSGQRDLEGREHVQLRVCLRRTDLQQDHEQGNNTIGKYYLYFLF